MDQTLSSLVSLVPSNVLVFHLERGSQPRTVLRISNISNNKIVFKVKTTQPTWYYVRPNQQMLDVGQSEDVTILLVDIECNRFLDQSSQNNEEKLDKHRFLVQSKVIEDAEYNRLLEMPQQSRSDEFTKIWEGPKDDRKNIKLKVEFKYPDIASAGNASQRSSSTTADTTVEGVRNRLSRNENAPNPSSSVGASAVMSATSPETIFTELQSLRKKYDAVVEYTVHLTAERDAIVNQLESSQRELVKEKSKKKSINAAGDANNKEQNRTDKKAHDTGFSFFLVFFIAILSFIIGKYLL